MPKLTACLTIQSKFVLAVEVPVCALPHLWRLLPHLHSCARNRRDVLPLPDFEALHFLFLRKVLLRSLRLLAVQGLPTQEKWQNFDSQRRESALDFAGYRRRHRWNDPDPQQGLRGSTSGGCSLIALTPTITQLFCWNKKNVRKRPRKPILQISGLNFCSPV